ncbi:C45 family autoproteolytic acyltransferase/hydolase [Thalassoglobus sp.]|uniref:C45 family autoproteolytic acyltransferase/hydolase n=1 Tax=Thalassoglobus sp. TaxID=2795869 RepID=UPI003AA97FA6
MTQFHTVLTFTFLMCGSFSALAAEKPVQLLQRELTPFASLLSGGADEFELSVDANLPIDGEQQKVVLRLRKLANGDYEFEGTHKDYSFVLQRVQDQTTFALPHHKVAFVGTGESPQEDHLAAKGISGRLVSSDSTASKYVTLVLNANPEAFASLIGLLLKPELDTEANLWRFGDKVTAGFSEEGKHCKLSSQEIEIDVKLTHEFDKNSLVWSVPKDFKITELPRDEIERQLVRGVRRATEILAPASRLIKPPHNSRKVENGELRWVEGQRVCILSGTPEQVGLAHGQLLKEEALKTIDSVLYTFGTVNTIRTGTWFHHDLNNAYKRLAPHIPGRHKQETKALATALEIDEHLAQTINVFPELFHCSGFAVFGSATADGKLYHGRVLDYMTTIGLQDAATTFIVSVDGKIPFANVGYAGFIGSVTGMNTKSISLGEMGGRGEGQWDGVPMATLMRRALEECSTLQEVMTLWETSPRTCEYYYVFADGKTNEAVGVAATPEAIEFIQPGQGHERLGEGIKDSVVLSAGSRLEKLRERVLEKHGKIDAETAIWLMSRPVAMKSNLHNALFVPEDGILYVANADHKHPAAERPYVKLNLKELLQSSVQQRAVSNKD